MKKLGYLFLLLLPSVQAELLCPDCSDVIHLEEDFENSPVHLWLIKHEILAVNGHQFDHQELKNYFEKQPWYKPLPTAIALSDIQKQNIAVIDKKWKWLAAIRPIIVQELNQIKYTPKGELLEKWEKDFPEDVMANFFKLLDYLDLTVFRYSDNFIITIEDDKLEQKYQVIINGDKVIFSHHEQTAKTDKLNEYSERYIQWDFKLENEKLIFQQIHIAG